MAQVILDRRAKTSPLEARATAIDDDDDVLVRRGEVVVPIHPVAQADLLRVRATIDVEEHRVLGLARVVHARGPDLAHVELCDGALGWMYACG